MSSLTGTHWMYTFYFNPQADKSKALIDPIKGRQLMTKLQYVVGVNEDIKTVSLYKCPLISCQLTMAFFYHKFVIIKTNKWFWSIEKDTEAIIIQRSKNKSDVKDKKDKEGRKVERLGKVKRINTARGKTSVHDLIKWLCDEHEIDKEYNAQSANCKDLANVVFEQVALIKWCYEIKFRPKADKDFISFYDYDLITTLVSFVDVNETILKVFLYENRTDYESVWICIFQTDAWWWSIENRHDIMVITRNEKESHVEQYFILSNKSGIQKKNSAPGKKSVHALIDWLFNKTELKKLHTYIVLSTKTFAKDVFDYVSGNAEDNGLHAGTMAT